MPNENRREWSGQTRLFFIEGYYGKSFTYNNREYSHKGAEVDIVTKDGVRMFGDQWGNITVVVDIPEITATPENPFFNYLFVTGGSGYNYEDDGNDSGGGGWLGYGLDKIGEIDLVANGIYSSLAKNSGNSTVGSNGYTYFAKSGQRGFYGNQYVTTKSLAGMGSRASKFLGPAGHVISLGQIGYGVYQDGGVFGYNAQVATGGAIGGFAGGFAGAKAGAAIGAAIGASRPCGYVL